MDLEWKLQCEDYYCNEWCEMMSDPYYWYDMPHEPQEEQEEEPKEQQEEDELPF
jgi:hypothetical protein